jgi:hypothetical protein
LENLIISGIQRKCSKNKPEAEAIVSEIAKIIQDEQYQDKTIGIIVLQGKAQQDIIHNLLLEKVQNKL